MLRAESLALTPLRSGDVDRAALSYSSARRSGDGDRYAVVTMTGRTTVGGSPSLGDGLEGREDDAEEEDAMAFGLMMLDGALCELEKRLGDMGLSSPAVRRCAAATLLPLCDDAVVP